MTQAQLAERLNVSASYVNLIENGRRRITVSVLLRLTELFDLDLADLADDGSEGRLVAELMEVLGDPIFDRHEIKTGDVRDFVAATPNVAEAVASLYGSYRKLLAERCAMTPRGERDGFDTEDLTPADRVDDFLQQANNYFPDLEALAERIRHDARLSFDNPSGALESYLEQAFGVRVVALSRASEDRVVRRYDRDRHVLEISEMLPRWSHNFEIAYQLALLDAGSLLDQLCTAGGLEAGAERRLGRIALANYFAAAMLMPYAPFFKQAETLRYDIELLQHYFGVSFEQVCRRLTSLQRPDMRGVPLHLLRVDIAGNVSKRFSLSGLHIPRHGGVCPRWNIYSAFTQPGIIHAQISCLPDGTRYFCIARTMRRGGYGHGAAQSHLSIGLGCEVSHAHKFVYSDGIDLERPDRASAIGITCRTCSRLDCAQRAFPPLLSRHAPDENVKGLSPYSAA